MGRTSDAKDRLVSSASERLYALGYQGVGVEELCNHAGVKKGSFYHFFPSKQDLAIAALDFQWDLAREGMVEPAFKSDLPPLGRIHRFFELMAEASASEKSSVGYVGGCRFGNLSAEMSSHDPNIREKVGAIFQAITDYFEQALAEAKQGGELPNIDPVVNAQALMAYMEGILLLGRTYDDPSLMKKLASKAIDLAQGTSNDAR